MLDVESTAGGLQPFNALRVVDGDLVSRHLGEREEQHDDEAMRMTGRHPRGRCFETRWRGRVLAVITARRGVNRAVACKLPLNTRIQRLTTRVSQHPLSLLFKDLVAGVDPS